LPEILLLAVWHSDFDFISPAGYFVSTGKRKFVINETDQPVEAQFGIFDGSILRAGILKETGLPEKNWFMMFDDFEFCYRMIQKGFRIGVIKNDFHQILHYGGGERFSKASIWRGYYHARNHTLFLKKYFSWQVLLDYFIIQMKTFMGLMAAPDRFKRIGFRLKGILHGMAGKDGYTLDPASLKFIHPISGS
jgi:GT2 family glycosyltransferase